MLTSRSIAFAPQSRIAYGSLSSAQQRWCTAAAGQPVAAASIPAIKVGYRWHPVSKVLLGGALAFGAGALLLHCTEPMRVCRAIRRGAYAPPAHFSADPASGSRFDPEWSTVPTLEVIQAMHADGAIVGIVGPESTGKTTWAANYARTHSNTVYVEHHEGESPAAAVMRTLRSGVLVLPSIIFPLTGNEEDYIEQIFSRVSKGDDHAPVTVVFDVAEGPVAATQPAPTTMQGLKKAAAAKIGGEASAGDFVSGIKRLTAARRCMRGLFTSSEPLMFTTVADPHLKLFVTKELTIAQARDFLHRRHGLPTAPASTNTPATKQQPSRDSALVTDDDLKRIPRTFRHLTNYAEEVRNGRGPAYVIAQQHVLQTAVKRTINRAKGGSTLLSMVLPMSSGCAKPEKLYKLMLEKGQVPEEDVLRVCKFGNEDDILDAFVRSNRVLSMAGYATYNLPSDAAATAVRDVLAHP
jgi:hypothetical protein